jgi:hypothetical protein
MSNKCIVCRKEFKSVRANKQTCSSSCRQKLHRKSEEVSEIKPVKIVENKIIETKLFKELVFTKETIEERIKIYKTNYKDSTFVPNWVAHGYNSKLEALHSAIEAVDSSKAIKNLGL